MKIRISNETSLYPGIYDDKESAPICCVCKINPKEKQNKATTIMWRLSAITTQHKKRVLKIKIAPMQSVSGVYSNHSYRCSERKREREWEKYRQSGNNFSFEAHFHTQTQFALCETKRNAVETDKHTVERASEMHYKGRKIFKNKRQQFNKHAPSYFSLPSLNNDAFPLYFS